MINKNKVTIKDIAEKAKVSKTTVSFYLNGKFEKMSPDTKRRIEIAINETGYSPNIMARSLKSKKSNLLGVIVADITIPFSNNIVKGIDEIARKKDYQIIVGSSNLNYDYEKKYVDRMLDMGVDGFIVQPTIKFNNLVEYIQNKGKKLVLLDSVSENFKGNFVKTDSYHITYKATKTLVEKGYKKFIFVTEDPDVLMARMERKEGFISALESCKMNYSIATIESEISNEKLAEILSEKIDNNKTLIFATNGKILQKVFNAVKIKQWDVPNSVGIIGFDNWDWTIYARPSVTTIEQPTYEEGKYAAEMLIQMIEEKNECNSKIFDCTINWAESTELK